MNLLNAKRTLLAAAAALAVAGRGAGGRHLRCRRHLPVPDLFEVGGCLQDSRPASV